MSSHEFAKAKLTVMTYTFRCDNKKCNKTLICLMSKYDDNEYFGRCNYCQSGRLKWIKNIDLMGVLEEQKIIHKNRRLK